MEKSIDKLGVWLIVGVFVSVVVGLNGLLVLLLGVTVGYYLVVWLLSKEKENKDLHKTIINSFFNYSLYNKIYNDEDLVYIKQLKQNIENVVNDKYFLENNKNTVLNSKKLEIAIYKQIINIIKQTPEDKDIKKILLENAYKHLEYIGVKI